ADMEPQAAVSVGQKPTSFAPHQGAPLGSVGYDQRVRRAGDDGPVQVGERSFVPGKGNHGLNRVGWHSTARNVSSNCNRSRFLIVLLTWRRITPFNTRLFPELTE